MQDADFEHLLGQVKDGKKLSQVELQAVRQALSTRSDVDPYTLLHILGKAKDYTSKDRIRSFASYGLDDPSDDGMLRRIAVQILAQWWVEKDVLDLIADRAFHDPSPLVRNVAASGIGTIGR